jgi:hypothetical protein
MLPMRQSEHWIGECQTLRRHEHWQTASALYFINTGLDGAIWNDSNRGSKHLDRSLAAYICYCIACLSSKSKVTGFFANQEMKLSACRHPVNSLHSNVTVYKRPIAHTCLKFLFNTVIYVFLLLGLCILIVRLSWLRFFRAFSSVVRQMPGYNSPSRGTARTFPNFLCCSQKFCVILCIVCFVSFCLLFVCKCVLYYCHRVATQLQLTNTSILKILYIR